MNTFLLHLPASEEWGFFSLGPHFFCFPGSLISPSFPPGPLRGHFGDPPWLLFSPLGEGSHPPRAFPFPYIQCLECSQTPRSPPPLSREGVFVWGSLPSLQRHPLVFLRPIFSELTVPPDLNLLDGDTFHFSSSGKNTCKR